ncbi:hypothetical protein HK104_001785 [Borealophlyctis nickersoniae]|nr:hypothetical protein HK104_001785 [Borealophlyctis nickersoniae]
MLSAKLGIVLALCLGILINAAPATPPVKKVIVRVRVPATAAVPRRRGLAWPWNGIQADFVNFSKNPPHVSWLYNWEAWVPAGLPANLEYVAMQRTASNIDQLATYMKTNKAKCLLGFNEPDLEGMSVATAVSLWRKYIQPHSSRGIRLGSPAPTNGPNGLKWLDQFLANCAQCHVYFVAVHWYGISIDNFKQHITSAYNIAKKRLGPNAKVWVTEFASQTKDTAQQRAFFDAALKWLDQQGFVERYSWFGAMRGNVVSPAAAMMAPGGGLTALGKAYL